MPEGIVPGIPYNNEAGQMRRALREGHLREQVKSGVITEVELQEQLKQLDQQGMRYDDGSVDSGSIDPEKI